MIELSVSLASNGAAKLAGYEQMPQAKPTLHPSTSRATTTTDKTKSSPGVGLQKKGRDIYVDS